MDEASGVRGQTGRWNRRCGVGMSRRYDLFLWCELRQTRTTPPPVAGSSCSPTFPAFVRFRCPKSHRPLLSRAPPVASRRSIIHSSDTENWVMSNSQSERIRSCRRKSRRQRRREKYAGRKRFVPRLETLENRLLLALGTVFEIDGEPFRTIGTKSTATRSRTPCFPIPPVRRP